MKVLIVDASRERRKLTVDALAQLTNVVIQGAVASVQSALYAVASARPDLVVTDAELPDGDGAHLVAKMRGLVCSPSVVVVAAEPTDKQRLQYLAAGVDLYVGRDRDLRDLQNAVVSLARPQPTIATDDSLLLLGRMTAGVIHDSNNYLCAIDATVSLLQRHPDDASLWAQLRQALDASARLNATLLAYARGSAPPPQPLDLAAVVRDVLGACGSLIPSNVVVTTELTSGVRSIQGVVSDFEQLVLNLVLNACDAMHGRGALHIEVTRTAASAVQLRVADTGAGFETPSHRTSGRGLGLGIVRAVVDKYEGSLKLGSRPEGGTIIDVMLPAA